MHLFATPAIVLKRVQHGESDLIVSLLTLKNGKISVIAKAAKKSKRRFAGVLELFSILNITGRVGRAKTMLPVLEEATLRRPLPDIQVDILKTAYASYWAELIYLWLEEGQPLKELFLLFRDLLEALNSGPSSAAVLNIIFQIRFLSIAGLNPNLDICAGCRSDIGCMDGNMVFFDIRRGGLVCSRCNQGGGAGALHCIKAPLNNCSG